MSDEKKQINDFNFTTKVRGSHVHALEAKPFKKNGVAKGEPKFSGLFLLAKDNPDLKRLQTEVTTMLTAKHPGKKLVARRLTQEEVDSGSACEIQVPWRSGDKEADRMKAAGKDGEMYRNFVLVKASSKYQPALSAIVDKKIVDFITDEAKASQARKYFYSGAYYVPAVGLNWYKGDEGKPDGVSLYLNALLYAGAGERLGGRTQNAAETFKGYLGSIKDEDPTGGETAGGLDDEIDF